MIRAVDLIQRKRDGGEIEPDDLRELVLAYTRGGVPDYQMAAFCMAVYFRGLNAAETFALTDAMTASGDMLDLHAALGRTVVDKHSTGGVGDKTSLVIAPIVAASYTTTTAPTTPHPPADAATIIGITATQGSSEKSVKSDHSVRP